MFKYLNTFYIIILLTTLPFKIEGQKFSTIEGYEGSVFSTFEDTDGRIWFCTSDGLVEYDGLNFLWYRHSSTDSTTISDNHAQYIYEDKAHNLWVGTQNGLNYFDRKKKKFTHFTPSNSALSHHRIKQVLALNDTTLFIATYGGGLNRFNIKSNTVELLDSTNGLPSNFVNTIYLENKEFLWIGTENGGISKLDLKTNTLKHFLPKDFFEHGFSDNNVACFTENKDQLYIGTWNKGLFVKDEKDKFTLVEPSLYSDFSDLDFQKTVKSIVFDKDGNWWIGTHNSLNFRDIKNGKLKIFRHNDSNLKSIPVGRNWTLLCDRNGILWAGFLHGGVCKYDPFENRVQEIFVQLKEKKEKVDAFTSAHYLDKKERYWLGTFDGKLQVFSKKELRLLTDYSHFFSKGEIIYCINEDHEGVIWVCTSNGLHLIFNGKNTFYSKEEITQKNSKLQSGGFYYVVFDSRQNVFLGGWNTGLVALEKKNYTSGIAHFENAKVYYSKNSILKDDKIWRLYMDIGDTLWISTDDGFYHFTQNRLTFVDAAKDVFSVYRINQTTLLRGHSNGLIEQWKNKKWVNYINLEAYCSKITSLYKFGKYLMVSSIQGIIRVDLETKKILKLTVLDGLESNVTGLEGPIKIRNSGLVYLTLKGLSFIEPYKISVNSKAPKLVFKNLVFTNTNGEDYDGNIDGNIFEIPYNHTKLRLGFSCFNYSKNQELKFYYKLEGIDTKWIQVPDGQREIQYNSLNPGKYTLIMYAVNADGFQSDKTKLCSFIIETPWWQTYWAYLVYLIVSILIMYFINSYSLIQVKAKNELQLQHALREKDKETLNAKINFFTNISHEIRTPLTLISAPIKALLKKENLDLGIKNTLQTVNRNTDFLIETMNELLEFKKVESGSYNLKKQKIRALDFIQNIVLHYHELALLKNIQLEVKCKIQDVFVHVDVNLLSKVFHNLLANAFKYTDNGGEISVDIISNNETVSFIIQDSGKGVSPEMKKHLFNRFESTSEYNNIGIGLALSKEIILAHKGSLKLKDSGEGACFEVNLALVQHLKEEIEIQYELEHDQQKCLLIVEDNKEIASFLKDILIHEYVILHANNGIEGIEIAQNNSIDLILSDVMMPILDGVSMCKQLKNDLITSHIPIILLSAKTGLENELEGLAAQADDYISKPFVPEILVQKIKNILTIRDTFKENILKNADKLEEDKILTIDDLLVQNLIQLIENNISLPEMNVEWLSDQLAINRSHLSRKIKAITGSSPMDFITKIRLKKAIQLLQSGTYRVSDVAYQVGFSNPKYFSAALKKNHGKSPSDFLPNS